jgi:hypothetical protein
VAQFWRTLVGNQVGPGAGTALANTTTLTDISPAPQVVIPANYLYVGQRLRLTAYGIYSNTSTPTLLLGVYYGGVAGTLIAATAANATPSGVTNVPWQVVCDIYVRTVGATGTVWANGTATVFQTLAGGASGNPLIYAMPTTQTQPITIATNAANALTVGAAWGSASSSNTITCEDAYVETLG